MKSCPGCGKIPSMDDDTVSNGDNTYHRDCYRKLVEAADAEPPDALERIANALEQLVAQQKAKQASPWVKFSEGQAVAYDPLAMAEKR